VTAEPARLAGLDGAPACVGRDFVGAVCGVFADLELERVVGLEVAGVGGARWFVPWVAVTLQDGVVHTESRLVFVGGAEVDYYSRHGVRLGGPDLATLAVSQDGGIVRLDASTTGVLAAA
jgi:hypothetical protein